MFFITNYIRRDILLNSLTSFRFIAALMVFFWHVGLFSQYQLGYMGVSFFFVLSGFILSYNYHSKFSTLSKEDIKKFYIARFAKIYPVHLLTLVLSIPLGIRIFLLSEDSSLISIMTSFISNLFLIHSYSPSYEFGTAFNGVSWSLSNEAFFYLMFPFLMWFLLKIGTTNKKIALSSICTWVVLFLLILLSSLQREVGIDDWLLHVFPLIRVFEFIIGMTLGLLFVKNKEWFTIRKKFSFTTLEILSILLLFASIFYSPHIAQMFKFSFYYIPFWCLLIWIFALQGGVLSKLLLNKFMILLGEISFSFYMIHQLVIRYMNASPLSHVFNIVISLTISIILSFLMYYYFEEPLRKRIRYKLKKNKEASSAHSDLITSNQ